MPQTLPAHLSPLWPFVGQAIAIFVILAEAFELLRCWGHAGLPVADARIRSAEVIKRGFSLLPNRRYSARLNYAYTLPRGEFTGTCQKHFKSEAQAQAFTHGLEGMRLGIRYVFGKPSISRVDTWDVLDLQYRRDHPNAASLPEAPASRSHRLFFWTLTWFAAINGIANLGLWLWIHFGHATEPIARMPLKFVIGVTMFAALYAIIPWRLGISRRFLTPRLNNPPMWIWLASDASFIIAFYGIYHLFVIELHHSPLDPASVALYLQAFCGASLCFYLAVFLVFRSAAQTLDLAQQDTAT